MQLRIIPLSVAGRPLGDGRYVGCLFGGRILTLGRVMDSTPWKVTPTRVPLHHLRRRSDLVAVVKREEEAWRRFHQRVRSEPVDLDIDGVRTVAHIVNEALIQSGKAHWLGNRRGECNVVSAILGAVLYKLNAPFEIVEGQYDGAYHSWVGVGGHCIDLTGEQFGLPRVSVWRQGTDTKFGRTSPDRKNRLSGALEAEHESLVDGAVERCLSSLLLFLPSNAHAQ